MKEMQSERPLDLQKKKKKKLMWNWASKQTQKWLKLREEPSVEM